MACDGPKCRDCALCKRSRGTRPFWVCCGAGYQRKRHRDSVEKSTNRTTCASPELDDWSRRHKKDGVVVSIPFGDTEEDAKAFFAEHGGDWPVLMDGDAAWAVAFGVLRPPESFLVGPGGIVVAKWQGQITADEVDRVVNDLELKAVDR